MFKMLTGRLPFGKENSNILNKQLPSLNEKRKLKIHYISDKTSNLVKSLLEKDPEQRLGSKLLNKNIKNDAFYNKIDWYKLEHGQIEPPIKPNLVNIYFIYFIND